jgi:peptidoglycan/LPS O-acetylase OafA/YrhL
MRFRALDGWRGIAALCVALFHFEAADHFYRLPLLRHSFLFVDFFFVLSGFVIAHAYGDRLASPFEARQFVVRRFGRVWPLHMAVLAGFLGVVVFKYALTSGFGMSASTPAFDPAGSTPLGALPSQMLLLQSVGVADRLTWNAPSWSISAEFWTYVLFALVVLVLPRYRRLAFTVLALIGAVLVIALSHTGMDVTYDLGFARCVFGFSAGCLVYWTRPRTAPISGAAATIAEVLIVLAILAFVSLSGRSALSFAAPLFFAGAVYVFSYEAGAVSRLLKTRSFQNLGLWSYSIYMVHALIVFVIALAASELQRRLGIDLWRTIIVDGENVRVLASDHVFLLDALHLAYAAIVVFVAAIAYRLIERPGQRYFQNLASRTERFDPRRLATVAANPAMCQRRESR